MAEVSPADQLLRPLEVAAMFRVDPKTVTRWADGGKLTSIRTLGGHRRFRESEVRAYLRSGEGPEAAGAPEPLPGTRQPDDPATGTRLRSARMKRGIPQDVLASRAGLTPAVLAKIEGGQLPPGPVTIAKLATALGTGSAELAGTRPPPSSMPPPGGTGSLRDEP